METTEQDDNKLADSSVATDANGQESSTEQTDDKQTSLTPEEQKALTGEEGPSPETGTEGDQENTPETEEQTETEQVEEQTEEQPEPEPPVVDKVGDEKLPFSRHERWKELVGQKNEYKTQVEQATPLVQQAQALNEFLASNQIPPQELQNALNYLRALRQDPQSAYAMLKPTYEQLAGLAGERLDPDLQGEVAAGTLVPERASEIQKSRAGQKYQQWKSQQGQQVQQQGSQTIVQQSLGSWLQLTAKRDADLHKGTDLWDEVDLRLAAMPKFQTAEQAWAGAEKAYTEAKARISRLRPATKAPAGRRPPQSQATGSNNRMVIKDSNDAVKLILASGGRAPANVRYK